MWGKRTLDPIVTTFVGVETTAGQVPLPVKIADTRAAVAAGATWPGLMAEAGAGMARIALEMANISFVDNRVKFADWPALKGTTPFGRLPVLEVDGQQLNFHAAESGDFRFCESPQPPLERNPNE